ncbi:MAG: transposase [SAR324 cluster bacterium]|nr:transposase [SAR324 cluster bacterium]
MVSMYRFNEMKNIREEEFKRSVGISSTQFESLLSSIKQYIEESRQKNPMKRRGISGALTLEDKLLLTLYYLRHYATFSMLGQGFGISESYANKVYHSISSMLLKVLHVPGPKTLMDEKLECILIDVSEQPIERPSQGQKEYYSGKKKRHTIKAQLVVCALTLQILCVVCAKGKVHDFNVLKESNFAIASQIQKRVDSGYQGMQKLYQNTHIPYKKPKGGELTPEQKQYNRQLAKERIYIEHVNRRCKIFRIVKETYRGKHKNFGKTWNLIAGIVNLRYAA